MCNGAQKKGATPPSATAPSATAPAKVTSLAWRAWRITRRAGATSNVASSGREGVLFRKPSRRQRELRRRGALVGFHIGVNCGGGGPSSTFPSAAELTAAKRGPSQGSSLSVSSLSLSVSSLSLSVSYHKTTVGVGRFKNGISSADISFSAAFHLKIFGVWASMRILGLRAGVRGVQRCFLCP